jgi:hypothetical protein
MRRYAFALTLMLPVWVGCGGTERFSVARTEGVVLCNGEPVENAQVYFEPIVTGKSAKVGKQAFAFSDADGAFVLSTYSNNDGAVVGKHRVRVGGDSSVRCECATDSETNVMEVEIVAGQKNTFTLDLPPKQKKQRTNNLGKVSLGELADEADSKRDEQE